MDLAVPTTEYPVYCMIRGLNSHGHHLQPLSKVFTLHLKENRIEIAGYTTLTTLCDRDFVCLYDILERFNDRNLLVRPITDSYEHKGHIYQCCYVVIQCKNSSDITKLTEVLEACRYKYQILSKYPWTNAYGNV
jgi:hypothetical protein